MKEFFSIDFNQPDYTPESEFVSAFYSECTKNKIFCQLEYVHDNCRFDAVIVYQGKIIYIIEFKRGIARRNDKAIRESNQIDKYARYGVPVEIVFSYGGVKCAIKRIKKYIAWIKRD